MQRCLLTFDNQRMSGIVATLESDNSGYFIGQKVYDLAFTFVTPLGAKHYNILAHDSLSIRPAQLVQVFHDPLAVLLY